MKNINSIVINTNLLRSQKSSAIARLRTPCGNVRPVTHTLYMQSTYCIVKPRPMPSPIHALQDSFHALYIIYPQINYINTSLPINGTK